MQNARDVIHEFEPLWGSWMIDEFIGQGNYGKVYRVMREEWGQKYVSAVKIISIPQTKSDLREAQSIGLDDSSVKGYFQDFAKNIINEIEMMYKLKGNSNIVSYEDHVIYEKKGELGWHIIIRMEYLKSLPDYIVENHFTKEKIIAMGIDICRALEACQHENIIHRDIKDANIFIAKNGNFKLGDFGIAKELSKTGRAASMRGTPLYMAPEVYKGQDYDSTVDTYSLGILMYRLLNKGRFPFTPPYPSQMTYTDTEKAIMDRMSGLALPMPVEAGEMLGKLVLKACSYDSKDRYKTPSDMRADLENILYNSNHDSFGGDLDKNAVVDDENEGSFNETVSIFEQPANDQEEVPEEEAQAPVFKDLDGTISIYDKKIEENLDIEDLSKINIARVNKSADEVQREKAAARPQDEPASKKKSKWLLPAAVLLILVISVSAFYFLNNGKKDRAAAGKAAVILEEIKINETLPQVGTIKLTLSGKYSDGTAKVIDGEVAWTSDNEDVAKIEDNGTLTFIENGYGKVNITAMYMDKKTVISTEVVKPIVLEAIKIVEEKTEKGDRKLTVFGEYSDGNKELISSGVRWSSDNEAAAVAEDGSVTIVKKDKSQIKINAEYEGKADSITIENQIPKPEVKKKTVPKPAAEPVPIQ